MIVICIVITLYTAFNLRWPIFQDKEIVWAMNALLVWTWFAASVSVLGVIPMPDPEEQLYYVHEGIGISFWVFSFFLLALYGIRQRRSMMSSTARETNGAGTASYEPLRLSGDRQVS